MMLGRSGGAVIGDRVFVYEVTGLRESDITVQDSAAIRNSSTVLMPVPFSRMNEFMQRINRLGGKIVAIRDHVGAPSAAPAISDGEG